MECAEIKKIIPKYFQHTANEEEIRLVEEHLCVCHDCRTVLGELMDKAEETPSQVPEKAEEPQKKPEERPEEVLSETNVRPEGVPSRIEGKEEERPLEEDKDMEYFPGKNIEASMNKINEILGEAGPDKEEEAKEKAEEKEPSFEIITEPPSDSEQESPVEKEVEALDEKEPEPVDEKEPEPVKEEMEEEPQEEKSSFIEKAEELVEEERPEEVLSETNVRPEESPEERLKEVPVGRSLPERGQSEEEEEPPQTPYPFEKTSPEKSNGNFLEYFCLIGGLAILGFLAYLLLKG